MKIRIRRATAKDLPVVTRLLAELGGEREIPQKRALELFRKMRRHSGYHVYVALVDGDPAGTFSLFVIPTLMHDGANEALVDGVVVTARYRGKGIGKQMMQHAMKIASDAGCYKLALSSNIDRDDAHRFYRNLGFLQHGISFQVAISQT